MKIENILTGKVVLNSYMIREPIVIYSFYSIWYVSSIYSAVRNLIQIIPKKFFNTEIKNFKEIVYNNFIKKIENSIAPIVEIGEIDNNYCFIIQIPEGESVRNFLTHKGSSSELYIELFLNISKIIQEFSDKSFFIPYFNEDFFWITTTRKIILFNHSFYLLKSQVFLKQRKKIQKYLIKPKRHFGPEEKAKIEKKNISILLGILFYSLIENKEEIKRLNKNIKKYEDSETKELFKCIADLIDKKIEYNLTNLIVDLENFIKKPVMIKLGKEGKKTEDSKESEKFYDFELSDRRLYFELLEKERKEKLERLRQQTESHLVQEEKNVDYYLEEYEKRKKYFENLEKERSIFLENIMKENEKNKDKLTEEAGNYFRTFFSEDKDSIKIEEYFRKLKESIENHIKDLKNKSSNFLSKILNFKNEDKIQGNYIRVAVEETKEKFIEIYDNIKNYYHNFLLNNLNQIKEFTKEKVKNIENITKTTLTSLSLSKKEFIEMYDKIVPALDEKLNFYKEEISLKEGIDIVKIEKLKINFLERFLSFLKFYFLFSFNKLKEILKVKKK